MTGGAWWCNVIHRKYGQETKMITRTIRPLSSEEVTMLLVSVGDKQFYCEEQLAIARSLDIDQEEFWNVRIDRCVTLTAALYDSSVTLVAEPEWDGTTARDFEHCQ